MTLMFVTLLTWFQPDYPVYARVRCHAPGIIISTELDDDTRRQTISNAGFVAQTLNSENDYIAIGCAVA